MIMVNNSEVWETSWRDAEQGRDSAFIAMVYGKEYSFACLLWREKNNPNFGL